MTLAHYILWRLASNSGPIALLYVIGIAAVMIVAVELIDRMVKRARKKKRTRQG